MKALLLADFHVMLKYTRAFLAMVVIFLAVSIWGNGNSFLIVYPVLMASILSTSIISYNERFHWDSFCDTLPISRAQAVSEKYVFTLMVTGTVFVLTAILQYSLVLRGKFSRDDYFAILDLLVVLSFFAPSLMLPVIFKLGMEKGRMAYYVVFGAAFAISMFLPDKVLSSNVIVRGPLVFLVLLVVCGAAYAVSWRLAIKFYEKRDL